MASGSVVDVLHLSPDPPGQEVQLVADDGQRVVQEVQQHRNEQRAQSSGSRSAGPTPEPAAIVALVRVDVDGAEEERRPDHAHDDAVPADQPASQEGPAPEFLAEPGAQRR